MSETILILGVACSCKSRLAARFAADQTARFVVAGDVASLSETRSSVATRFYSASPGIALVLK